MSHETSEEKKLAIIDTTWEYLMKKGLEQASIGELCKETKLAQSSIYYWFDNKYDLWISAGKYGLSKIVDALFTYTFAHVDKPKEYFDTLLNEVDKYKYELRLAIQITTSPMFGEHMRNKSKEFNAVYEAYAERIIAVTGCSAYHAEIFIYTVLTCVIDYAVWDDGETTQKLLDNLYHRVVRTLDLPE